MQLLKLDGHIFKQALFHVDLGLKRGDLALVVGLHHLLFFLKLRLDPAYLQLGVGGGLRSCILVTCLVRSHGFG